jgi:hypothetical protein
MAVVAFWMIAAGVGGGFGTAPFGWIDRRLAVYVRLERALRGLAAEFLRQVRASAKESWARVASSNICLDNCCWAE